MYISKIIRQSAACMHPNCSKQSSWPWNGGVLGHCMYWCRTLFKTSLDSDNQFIQMVHFLPLAKQGKMPFWHAKICKPLLQSGWITYLYEFIYLCVHASNLPGAGILNTYSNIMCTLSCAVIKLQEKICVLECY